MKYLVGFSPDQGGREALALAAVLARSTGGSLVVCTIIPETWGHPPPARVDAEYASFLNQNAEKALAKARATLPGDIAAEFVARAGRRISRPIGPRKTKAKLEALLKRMHPPNDSSSPTG